MKYRHIIVDFSDGWYTSIIQCRKWYGWVTIKTIESPNLSDLREKSNQIMDLLKDDYGTI